MLASRAFFRSSTAAMITLLASAAHAQTFSNTSPITIPSSGPASPYPSSISVAGVTAPIQYISVTLNGLSHTWVSDVNVLLVAPGGQKVLLMANTNGSSNASNNTLTFVSDVAPTLPVSNVDVVSGIYTCSVYAPPAALPAPAPAGPYATTLAPLTGAAADGNWSLYVWDDVAGDAGSIANGWSITFSESPSRAFTYQGVLSSNGLPISDDANVRFTLCNSATESVQSARIANPLTQNFTGISDGLITAKLDFGAPVDSNQALWLNIEVESPPGSGFVTLSPRQSITPTPHARVAQNANTAQRAISADQLAPGRVRIRGDAGASGNSPGIWFASPIDPPVDRAFVGMVDDTSIGLFNTAWNFRLHSNGNVAIGDPSGNPPNERLTVTGSVQINTSVTATPNLLAFGFIGNQGLFAENTDAVYFQRFNATDDSTELRLIIGDNPGATGTDSLRICTTSTGGGLVERIRFQSDGNVLKPGGGSWGVLSDPRAKHDIAPLSGTLNKLLNLRGYSFLYNDDRIASGIAMPGVQVGLMADEVAQVFPDWVSIDADGTRYVTERATTALMVEALRDLRAEKDAAAAAAQAQIDALNAQNADLKSRLERLEAAINAGKP